MESNRVMYDTVMYDIIMYDTVMYDSVMYDSVMSAGPSHVDIALKHACLPVVRSSIDRSKHIYRWYCIIII